MTIRDTAWRQQEPIDWTDMDPSEIDFPEEDFTPPVPDPDYEAWLDDFDRRFSDMYDTANGDIGDDLPPF
jgi:hypothetical protein